MSVQDLAILKTGMVTAVGLTAPSACAAIRAKLTNPTQTRFVDSAGEWITGCVVPLAASEHSERKLTTMAARVAMECLADVPRDQWSSVALLLCVAENGRPGREQGLEDELRFEIERALGVQFADESAVVPLGRCSAVAALSRARELIYQQDVPWALILATDSLLAWPTLGPYERSSRVLTPSNSDGFIPGEAAAGILVGRPSGGAEMLCVGLGHATETATVDSELPLRADGLVKAIRAALDEADCGLHDMDLRVADLSGEQYYFKEAALIPGRIMRQRKAEFDIWHAAECTGEVGAAAGVIAIAVSDAACRKAYAPGPAILVHTSNDGGERAAAVLAYGMRQ
jgi:3-oxoacyl-[acyl-carrier-protein] synthase-1